MYKKKKKWRYGLPYLSTWIIISQYKNINNKLNKTGGALHYKIGEKNLNLFLEGQPDH